MPFLGLGRTPYAIECDEAHYSRVLAGLALRLAQRLDAINAVRRNNAERLYSVLRDLPQVEFIETPREATCVYPRLPVLVAPDRRAEFVAALNDNGVGATTSYPEALVDVPELSGKLADGDQRQQGARKVARSIVTLPTHRYSPADMPLRVRDAVRSTLAS
jgi:dTDP-4-amino-4,6-dideoxygalactose transaminase